MHFLLLHFNKESIQSFFFFFNLLSAAEFSFYSLTAFISFPSQSLLETSERQKKIFRIELRNKSRILRALESWMWVW